MDTSESCNRRHNGSKLPISAKDNCFCITSLSGHRSRKGIATDNLLPMQPDKGF
jgi:hypothetical protein